jgi:ankyrin repeat protein
LDSPDHSGKTALIYATQNQDLELVKALLEAGAKPNRIDLEDKTALDYARELGNRELVELLEGAKP